MSSFCKCKSYSHFFSKNISLYAVFNDQSFNNILTNDIVIFEQLGSIDLAKICWLNDSVHPDQILHSVLSDLDLHCLLRHVCPNT